MPPPRHWGGNKGSKWSRTCINGVRADTYDMPSPDQMRPTLDITIVEVRITRRYVLEPLDLPPRPGAKGRLWKGK